MTRQQIECAIFEAMDELNAVLPENMQLERSAESVIFGRGGKLDSLGLVNFVLAVEDRLKALGLSISLTDERAMSQSRSPFRSVAALTAFVEGASQETCQRVQ
jgi:acyl carrier protein